VRGNGSPSVTFTPLPNDATLIAVIPTSWYGAITASNSPRIARTKTVSAGNGPSIPAARAAGARSDVSSFPNLPPSPPCGFSAQSAIRGSAMPNQLRRPSRAMRAASVIEAAVSFSLTSRNGMWVVARTTRSLSDASIIATRALVKCANISVCPG
jgi:hypothetical protein